MANGTIYLWVVALLALLIGGLLGAVFFPTEKEVIVPKTELKVVEVPVPQETKIDVSQDPVAKAIKDFLHHVDDTPALQKCDGDQYDVSQISIVRVEESEITKAHNDDAGEYSVEFSARVKYLDNDVEEKCYEDFDVEVTYDNDKEEPSVEVD